MLKYGRWMVALAAVWICAGGLSWATEQKFTFYVWGHSFFEGSTLKHEVRSFSPNELPPDLWFRTKSGTAEEGLDFAHAKGKLTFSRAQFGWAVAPFEIVSIDDSVREGGETFYLQIATEEDFREGSILQELTMHLGDNEVPWILDTSFNPNGVPKALIGSWSPWANASLNPVSTVAVQPDGKILMGGIISSESSDYRGLVRLHPNGEVDSTFRTGTALASVRKIQVGARGQIYAVAFASDGSEKIVKLDAQGRLIWSKEAKPGNFVFEGHPLLAREDGTILVGGYFTNVVGVDRKYVALLDSEGNVLPEFNLGLNGVITAAEQLPEGRVLIGGKFTMVGDQPRLRVARLNANGELDTSFDPGNVVSQEPTAFAVQPDGKILVSGGFNTNNGAPHNRLMRLDSDGSLDETFRADLDDRAYGIAVDQDGKILLGGAFNQVNGMGRPRLARLLADGSLDVAYDLGEGPNDRVMGVRINEDGTYLIWGNFQKIGRHPMRGVAQLLPYSNTITVDFVDHENFAVELYREAHVQLERFGETSGELEVELSVIPGNEAHLAEFAPWSTRVRFAPLESRKFVKIPFADDGEVEGPENLVVTCRVVGEATAKSARLVILDDEEPVISEDKLQTKYRVQAEVMAGTHDRVAIGGYVFKSPEFGLPGVAVGSPSGAATEFESPTFGPEGHVWIDKLAWTTENKLYVGGRFERVNGLARINLVRLNSDGRVDSTFNPPFNISVGSLAAQADGKLLVASLFPISDGTNLTSVLRLKVDGSVDESFAADLPDNTTVIKVLLQPDGKILAYTERQELFRLLEDGSRDPDFQALEGNRIGSVSLRNNLLSLLPDGKILISGHFSQIDGILRNGLARLNADGSLDRTYVAENHGYLPSFLGPDGSVLYRTSTGQWQVLNPDGSLNRNLILSPGFNHQKEPVAVLADGRIVTRELDVVPVTNTHLSSVLFEKDKIFLEEKESLQEVKVKRVGRTTAQMTANIDLEITKGEESDDILLPGNTITFNGLQTAHAIAVTVRKDDLVELDEHFRLKVSGQTGEADKTFVVFSDITVLDRDGRPGSATLLGFLPRYPDESRVFTLADGRIVTFSLKNQVLRLTDAQAGTTIQAVLPIEGTRFVSMIAASPEGGFLVGGNFPGQGEFSGGSIFKVKTDGTLDPDFSSPTMPFIPRFIVAEPDGRILAGGEPTTFPLEANLARLKSDGTVERSYKLAVPRPWSAALLPGGKLAYASWTDLRIFDLEGGREFSGFTPVQVGAGYIEGIIPRGDSLYIWGGFNSVEGISRRGIARVSMNGAVDPFFNPLINPNELSEVFVDPQGRALLFGGFTTVNNLPFAGAARINPDGSVDRAFDPGESLTSTEYRHFVKEVVTLPNGDMFAVLWHENTQSFRTGMISMGEPLQVSILKNELNKLELHLNTSPQATYVIEKSIDLEEWEPFSTNTPSGYQIIVELEGDAPLQFLRAVQQ